MKNREKELKKLIYIKRDKNISRRNRYVEWL